MGEMTAPTLAQDPDSGLAGLSLIAGYYHIAADPAQLSHQLALARRTADSEDLIRAANLLRLKSRIRKGITAKRLAATPFPAMIGLKGGTFGVLGVGSARGRPLSTRRFAPVRASRRRRQGCFSSR